MEQKFRSLVGRASKRVRNQELVLFFSELKKSALLAKMCVVLSKRELALKNYIFALIKGRKKTLVSLNNFRSVKNYAELQYRQVYQKVDVLRQE